MNAQRIANQHHATFEGIRQQDAEGNEFWSARDLQPLLEYAVGTSSSALSRKAIEACRQSGNEADDHFFPNGENGRYRFRSQA